MLRANQVLATTKASQQPDQLAAIRNMKSHSSDGHRLTAGWLHGTPLPLFMQVKTGHEFHRQWQTFPTDEDFRVKPFAGNPRCRLQLKLSGYSQGIFRRDQHIYIRRWLCDFAMQGSSGTGNDPPRTLRDLHKIGQPDQGQRPSIGGQFSAHMHKLELLCQDLVSKHFPLRPLDHEDTKPARKVCAGIQEIPRCQSDEVDVEHNKI